MSIPTGWILCDGNGGSPDLRDQFVIGSGSTFSPGDSGGDTSHTHSFTGDGHAHTLLPGSLGPGIGGIDDVTDGKNISGVTNSTAHLPQYFSLAYILKIS